MNPGDFYQKFLDQVNFSNLKTFVASNIALLSLAYLCEQFFSKMGFIKSLSIIIDRRTLGEWG